MRGVPQSLTVGHKTKRKDISSEFLACFEAEGETFLSCIATAVES
jgi:hypothetical protein